MEGAPATSIGGGVPRRARLDRMLHGWYFRASWVHHFFSWRVRPAGAALAMVLVLATSLGIGHDRGSIYFLFSFSLGLLVISAPWAFLRRASLTARREVPRHATAGEPLRYRVTVVHEGRRPLSRGWLAEMPPDPRPGRDEFILLREPGEESRNGFDRVFAYFRWQWLLLRRRLFTDGFSTDELRIPPGGRANAIVEVTPLRRGVIRLGDLRVLLPDPCGLFQSCVRVVSPPVLVTVLPRRFRVPPVVMPGSSSFQISGETSSNAIGNSGEFTGLRDYRPGDPLRQIHWRSWARTGRPIVKELEDTCYPRHGLILDTLSTGRSDAAFEEAVSVAASFVAALDSGESLLDLMFVKNEAHRVTAGRGIERADKLLEVLAAVSPCRSGDLMPLARLVQRHAGDMTSCLALLNGWDPLRADFLAALRQGGVVCVPVVIGAGPRPPGVPGYWLESGFIERDLALLPRDLVSQP
jgi:uncharacterized protein (DUF58 family)